MRSAKASPRPGGMSRTLILSYVIDWVIIIVEAAIGFVFGVQSPHKRPFSVADPNVSFPFTEKETISTALLFVVGLIIPAAVIVVVVVIFVPGPTVPKTLPRALVYRRKLWEWYTSWSGLALSCATAWLVTNGMKNLFGHYRPDMLSRCDPDLDNIQKYAVGGFPSTAQGAFLVSAQICRTTDMDKLDDGFRSFPSGHASFSAAGLVYLSLFLASKLAITVPFLSPRAFSTKSSYSSAFPSRMDSSIRAKRFDNGTETAYKGQPMEMSSRGTYQQTHHEDSVVAARHQAAAPPLYLLVFVFVPFLTAIYISSTRYSEFRHFGFDLLFGFFIGTVAAYFSFRLYHLPIAQGAGWAWGPRSRDRAFWAGVGVGSYATSKAEDVVAAQTTSSSAEPLNADVEAGAGPSTRAYGANGESVGENLKAHNVTHAPANRDLSEEQSV